MIWASAGVAGVEPANKRATLRQRKLSHDVSILIAAGGVVGCARGAQPRWKISMMTIRPPTVALIFDVPAPLAVR